MRRVSLIFVVCVSLIFGFSTSLAQWRDAGFVSRTESSVSYKYDRFDEVKRHCASVLSSAAELRPSDDVIYRVKDDLSVRFGDWFQDKGEAPILPFDDSDIIRKNLTRTPLNIASFWVTDVDFHAHRSKKFVSVSGELQMEITVEMSYMEKTFGSSPQFRILPGHTELLMLFQGVYTESKKNDGERVLCLLGTAMLPSREPDSSSSWEWVKSTNYYQQPPLLQDDQILLVLRSPKTFRLTNRAIVGELSSLNPKSNLKYFDKVHILSQFGKSSHYEFGSETIVSKACDPYPYHDSFTEGGIEVYRGTRFCEVLEEITNDGGFLAVPNWKCNNTDSFCSKLGPFGWNKEINETDGGFKDVKIIMQNVRCEQMHRIGNSSSAKVAAAFRVATPSENQYSAVWRSGVDNMTVAAEGIWKSSSGQLCMVGCLGLPDAQGQTCDSRICLYIPLSYSIKQRSIVVGSFSSIEGNASYPPLLIEKLLQPTELWNYFRVSNVHYSYSKLDKAAVVLERNEAFSFGTVIKKSLLQFPKLEDSYSYFSSLSLLSEDLTLHISAIPESRLPRADIQMEILSIGPLFGRYWSNDSTKEEETPYHTKPQYTEKQLLLNVSAQLSVVGKPYSNFSGLFLEGLYDEHVGKMYLIGCRDVRASWKILFDSMDLENGLDCLIEVVVSYPPTTSRWLINPTATISIASQRNEDDPLYFKPIKLQTLPIVYRRQREDILSRRGIEGILHISTLSFAIACIVSQLFYIKHNLDCVPFMSLVILGVQALGYSLPLITGAEALFKRADSESDEMNSFNLQSSQWFKVIDATVKLLVLVSFLLTLRLCQKVWKSRISLQSHNPLEPNRAPSEKRVLFSTSIIHLLGYIILLIIHSSRTSQTPLTNIVSTQSTLPSWLTKLEEYIGLIQDFFLLPQVIGNIIWQHDYKPLRKLYFMGITVVRLLPHIYDLTKSPYRNPYLGEEYEFANPNLDLYSKFGDIAIPMTAVLLAAVVYIQQRWGYEKVSQMLTFGRYKLLPSRTRGYERLSAKYSETELAANVNGSGKDEEDEE